MNVNKLSEARISHANTRKIKWMYQLEGKKHSESFLEISKGRIEKKVTGGRNGMVAS